MTKNATTTVQLAAMLVLSWGVAACATNGPRSETPSPSSPPVKVGQGAIEKVSPDKGKEVLEKNARTRRQAWTNKSFAEFEGKVYREPFAGGKYIVNGDTTILNKKQLQEFFETQIQREPPPPDVRSPKLTVNTVNGLDTVWNSIEKRRLTYCVSKTFGSHYDQAVADMQAAGGAWKEVAEIEFVHVVAQDQTCDANNSNVVFDVRPVNVNGQYLARAFFPNDPRASRNVLIDDSSFQLAPTENLKLVGILRHELGHTLGFRHEHTRPDSGKCFEDTNWRPLTSYDAFSVMHYPQCNGQGDWSLTLTNFDKSGAACLYGAAPGFQIDPTICSAPTPGPEPVPCGVKSETIAHQHVGKNEEKRHGPFPVSPGTVFEVKMQGETNPGDPDLYVSFGQVPIRGSRYDCRPYLSGADESCSLDVPNNKTDAFILVHGYAEGNYNLNIVHTPPSHQ